MLMKQLQLLAASSKQEAVPALEPYYSLSAKRMLEYEPVYLALRHEVMIGFLSDIYP